MALVELCLGRLYLLHVSTKMSIIKLFFCFLFVDDLLTFESAASIKIEFTPMTRIFSQFMKFDFKYN